MGTQKERAPSEWLQMANNLLSKCCINLKLRTIRDCSASVFVALYEAILGEPVPDYIAAPRSQEDDSHNVQSVIDSLALDYLQISLSHITGENIVRGDKESIRNLLEIFDGLLEYLTEEISDASSEEEEGERKEKEHNRDKPPEEKELQGELQTKGPTLSNSPLQCSDEDGSDSTGELIKLGDTAARVNRSIGVTPCPRVGRWVEENDDENRPSTSGLGAVKARVDGMVSSNQLETCSTTQSRVKHADRPVCQAIPLQPPYQPTQTRAEPLADHMLRGPKQTNSAFLYEHRSTLPDQTIPEMQRSLSPPVYANEGPSASFPAHEETKRSQLKEQDASPPVKSCPHSAFKRVAFRSQPEVRLMSLSRGTRSYDGWQEDDPADSDERSPIDLTSSFQDEPLSRRRAMNRRAERELQEMSEKLSRRLEELDLMLKVALQGKSKPTGVADEDLLSHHSDSAMECKQRKWGSAPETSKLARTRSLSPSPPRACRSLYSEFEDVLGQDENERRKGKDQNVRQRKDLNRPCKQLSAKQPVQAKKPVPMKIKDHNLLPLLLEEFPHLQVSHPTLKRMWQQQFRQIEQLSSPSNDYRSRVKLISEVDDAQRKHDLLAAIIRKEKEHNQRLKDFKQRIQEQKMAKRQVRDHRQQVARARKYYSDYHVQLRAKMLRARTHEERIFKNLFEEGLKVQKQQLLELRSNAKQQRDEQWRQHQDQMESMENYYKSQFSLMAEMLAQEREDIQVRRKAQEKALQKMKKELRDKMKEEIDQLQRVIVQNDEDDYFRKLEAERLRQRLHMASFQYSAGHLP
ncbi:centrosomal protein of 95 kDa-like isoform X2 [Erpetoichthys calabaricus]|uniref:centrosomal protein of 95 kDa-like isoform X2 n=1 Tax=Erpetoichthys calabaricus TaxID=27687 RepID=UPI002234594D|nr:centrosomal protein of 95 kDa-like isoform X2 [Erpetoichthys calabaricus]